MFNQTCNPGMFPQANHRFLHRTAILDLGSVLLQPHSAKHTPGSSSLPAGSMQSPHTLPMECPCSVLVWCRTPRGPHVINLGPSNPAVIAELLGGGGTEPGPGNPTAARGRRPGFLFRSRVIEQKKKSLRFQKRSFFL